MPRSTSDSFRDNELACATFSTPFGISFFGWTGDEYRKLTMEELRPQFEAWERHQAALREQAHAVKLACEADEARVEEELFKEDEGDVQDWDYLTVEDYVPEIIYDTKPLTIRDVDASSFSWKGPSKFIVIVQDVEADSALIHEKLDVGDAFVTEEEVSEEVVLKVNDATSTPSYKSSASSIGAHLLKCIFGKRNAAIDINDGTAAEDLEDEREVEEWLFVGVCQADDEDVPCKAKPKQRRPRVSINVKRRSLASIGNNMMR